MPMQVFIDIQINKDLQCIVIEGEHTSEEMLLAWEQIIEEYGKLTNTIGTDYLFELRKSIEYGDKRLVILRTILDWLKDRPSEAVSTLLTTEYGYTFEGDTERIWSMAKGELHRLKIKAAELEKLEASPKTENTRMDWVDNIGVLSEYQGFKFNPKTETVAEYISLLNRFKAANTPKNGR